MKKIIITIIALAFSVCAFAKDINQLAAEWSKCDTREARVEYVKANVVDIAKAYPQWLKNERKPSSRGLFAATYYHTNALDGISDYEALALSTYKLYITKTSSNPNWYDDVKSGGFKIDGVQLSNSQIFDLARFAKDKDTLLKIVLQLPVSTFTTDASFKIATDAFIQMKDCETAKEKLIELQTLIAIRNPNDARLDKIKTYLRIVREKCIDAKLK